MDVKSFGHCGSHQTTIEFEVLQRFRWFEKLENRLVYNCCVADKP